MVGGWYGADTPPYAPAEYYDVPVLAPLLKLHLFRLRTSWQAGPNPGTYKVLANGTVHDQAHAVIAGVTVHGDWTYPNGRVVHRTGMTNAVGRFKLSIPSKQAGTYQFCVTDMVRAGYAYDPGSNHVPACQTLAVGP